LLLPTDVAATLLDTAETSVLTCAAVYDNAPNAVVRQNEQVLKIINIAKNTLNDFFAILIKKISFILFANCSN